MTKFLTIPEAQQGFDDPTLDFNNPQEPPIEWESGTLYRWTFSPEDFPRLTMPQPAGFGYTEPYVIHAGLVHDLPRGVELLKEFVAGRTVQWSFWLPPYWRTNLPVLSAHLEFVDLVTM